MALLDHRGIKDNKAMLELKDHRDSLDAQDHREALVDLEQKGNWAYQDFLDLQVVTDFQVDLDYPVLQGQSENQERMELKEMLGLQEKRDSRDQRGL